MPAFTNFQFSHQHTLKLVLALTYEHYVSKKPFLLRVSSPIMALDLSTKPLDFIHIFLEEISLEELFGKVVEVVTLVAGNALPHGSAESCSTSGKWWSTGWRC